MRGIEGVGFGERRNGCQRLEGLRGMELLGVKQNGICGNCGGIEVWGDSRGWSPVELKEWKFAWIEELKY